MALWVEAPMTYVKWSIAITLLAFVSERGAVAPDKQAVLTRPAGVICKVSAVVARNVALKLLIAAQKVKLLKRPGGVVRACGLQSGLK